MSTIGMRSTTLADYARRLCPENKIGRVMEILEQSNEILDDAMFREANGPTAHRTTIRTGLPESCWHTLNRTVRVDERIGIHEVWSVVDSALADLNGQQGDFLLSEERAFLEGMNQEVAKTIFYGDLADNTAAFHGLAPRYSTLDRDKAENAVNVIDAGGLGDACTSAWLCVWGDLSLHLIYPKGTSVGLRRDPLGRCPVVGNDCSEFMGYKTNYSWALGLVVRDWRYVVRVANIDPEKIQNEIWGERSFLRNLVKAHSLIPNIRLGRAAWYMNRDVKILMDCLAAEKANVNLTVANFAGESMTSFKGVPIRQVDALHSNEAHV